MDKFSEFKRGLLDNAEFLAGAADGLKKSALVDLDAAREFFEAIRRNTQGSLDGVAVDEDAPPAIMVLSNQSRLDAKELSADARKITDIDIRTPDLWQGNIIFCARHGGSGWLLPLVGSVDNGLQLLEEQGFGDRPVVVVYPKERILTCFPDGAVAGEEPLRLPLPAASRPVTLDNIFQVVEEARRKSLLIPASAVGLWNDGPSYTPAPEAERRIQWIVHAWLSAQFSPTIVEMEQGASVGRIDIVMIDAGPVAAADRCPAVIELKVFRSKSQNGKAYSNRANEIAAAKGLRQTKAYRVDKGAKVGALACFDMRQQKDDLLATDFCRAARDRYFQDDAALEVRRFAVYGTSDDAQEELAA